MARKKTIKISGLNIVSQPHSPQKYLEIFEFIKETGPSIRALGDTYLKLVNISNIDEKNPLNGIKGQILKYSRIDKDSVWVNTVKGAELAPDQAPIIPEALAPNAIFYDFVFYPQHEINNHKFLYISQFRDSNKNKTRFLSPKLVEKFFKVVFEGDKYFQQFESIEVTVLPDSSALEKVLSLETVKVLEILIKAPNPDDFSELETRILKEMESTNVSQKYEKFTFDGESIEPDEEMRNDARVASTNGYVKVKGRNKNGKSEVRSTTDIPLREDVSIDADAPDSGFFALLKFLFTNK